MLRISTTLSLLIFTIITYLIAGCSPTESYFKDNTLILEVDPEVTEAWITLTSEPVEKNAIYYVARNDSLIWEGTLTSRDSLIHDVNLAPGTNYSYSALALKNGQKSDVINADATTLDTSNFHFQIDEFDGPPGITLAWFSKCWIWDTDDFWVVGGFSTRDSMGKLESYTVLSYSNGNWEKIDVLAKGGFQSPTTLNTVRGFWANDKNDVWFVAYDVFNWKGKGSIARITYDGDVEHIWGADENTIYFGGKDGLFLQQNHWVSKLNFPGDYYIFGIYGTESKDVMVSVRDQTNNKYKLLLIEGLHINELSFETDYLYGPVWFKDLNNVFIAGVDIALLKRDLIARRAGLKTAFSKIQGTSITNVFAVTYYGEVYHFNGIRWRKIYSVPYRLYDIQVNENFAVATGNNGSDGIIVKINY